MTPGKYQLSTTRGGVEVFRQGFGDRDAAYQALGEALAQYPDCEVRLTDGDDVLISAGPAPIGETMRGPRSPARIPPAARC